ncbi:probable chitinase 10 isoform X2 [Daktulosphaira vitifoliae]|uniref:probable chitinase 10 isoform X2 n=1 Tax=Daktulosphaira vitifoliae TaxID=58002 RepID=UPI0021AA3BCB|nr:probable chitinase 10 isoform X2 [Daktulosphaira vitifoliae]
MLQRVNQHHCRLRHRRHKHLRIITAINMLTTLLTVIFLSVPSRGQPFFSDFNVQKDGYSSNLPSRAAVERIPDFFDRYKAHSPIRDAVEKLPSKFSTSGVARYRSSSEGDNVICHVDVTQYFMNKIPQKLERIILSSCTHILYSSESINFDNIANHRFSSQSNGTLASVLRLKKKNPSIRVLLYVNDITPESISVARRDFIISANDMLKTNGFDGIVLTEVLPRSTNELFIDHSAKEEFPLLVEELASVLKTKGYLLGLVVGPYDHIVNNYDTARIIPNIDLFILKSFDFRKDGDEIISHHSPLYSSVEIDPSSKYRNVDHMVKYWLHKGVAPNQLIVGIAFFGRSFTLADPKNYQPGSRSIGNGYAGQWTRTPGFLSFYEICERMKRDDWEQYSDIMGSPFLVRDDQWISYENSNSLIRKLGYVEKQGLRGVMLWSIDSDDFNGVCGSTWPLIKTISNFKNEGLDDHETELREAPNDISKKKVVCYYASWSWYRYSDGKFSPEYIKKDLCTHVIYAFASLEPNDLIMVAGDEWEDIENKIYQRFISRVKSENTKIMVSLGGWTDSYGDKYSKLVSSGIARRKFVNSAVAYLRKYGFDGLHLDWNYPVCWQADCSLGPLTDKINFVKLIQDLKTELKKQNPPLELSSSISGYDEIIKEAYDFPILSQHLDFMTIMTYDFHGSWENITGHVSPGYYKKGDEFPKYNMDSAVKLIQRLGADPNKIVVGLPLYGQSYTLASNSEHGLGDPIKGAGIPGEYTQQPGMLAYYEICNRVNNENWEVSRDKKSGLDPYAYHGNQWVSYEDEISIRIKSEYILKENLGGAMVWTIDLDDFNNRCCKGAYPLLTKVNEVFNRISIKNSNVSCNKPNYPVTPANPVLITTEEGEGGWEYQVSTTSTTFSPPSTEYISKPSYQTTTTPEPEVSTPSFLVNQTTENQQLLIQSTNRPPARPWWSEYPTTRPGQQGQQQNPRTCVEGSFKPSRESCQNYFKCKNGKYRRHSCKQGLLWNRYTNKCDLSEIVNCNNSGKPIVDDLLTMPEKSTSTSTNVYRPPTIPTTENSKVCIEGEKVAIIDDCTSYYLCSYGIYIKQNCAPGLAWNDQVKLCDWKENVYCDNKRSENRLLQRYSINNPNNIDMISFQKLPNQIFVIKSSNYIECQDGQFSPHPGDCNKYLQCLWGKYNTNSCPTGLYWNARLNVCDWPYNSGCSITQQISNYPTNVPLYPYEIQTIRPTSKPISRPTISTSSTSIQNWWQPSTTNIIHTEDPWAWKPELTTENPGWWKPEPSTTQRPFEWQPELTTENPGWWKPETSTTQHPFEWQPETTEKPFEWKPATTTENPWEWKPTTTTAATLPTKKPDYQLTEKYKVVCYFTNWAWYRPSPGKFFPEDTDPNLCTHVIYGFATLDYTELTIRVYDSWADIDNAFYERLVALKKRGVKVSIGLGGWNDSAGDKYSRMVNSRASRKKFISSILNFIQKYGFQGLDLDWEYPKCWQTNCNQGPDSDKQAFSNLVIELRQAFKPFGYLLSAAVSPSKTVINAGYDVPSLSQYLDWIGVMAYDYHGQWDKKTGHIAPIYYHPNDDISYFNINYTINYWISKGANSRKIVLGVPLYGQSFTLSDPNNHGLNAPASAGGEAGQFTRSAGFLAYYEICIKLASGQWNIVHDPKRRMGPYAYNGNQWVGYDDIWSIRQKSEYVKSMNLGGAMIWALDLDDFRNICGQGHYPLLTTIVKTLGQRRDNYPSTSPMTPDNGSLPLITGAYPSIETSTEELVSTKPPFTRPTPPSWVTSSTKPISNPPTLPTRPTRPTPPTWPTPPTRPTPPTWPTPPTRPTNTTPITSTNLSAPEYFKVVCYFTNWAWYRQGGGRYLPSDIDPSLCTHIVYGFAILDNDELIIKAHDPWADYDNFFYQKVTELKKFGAKILLAIGGWNDSAGSKYSKLVNSQFARSKFIRHVVSFLKQNNFDGLDLDWEYPKCWQVDCTKGPSSDKEGFSNLLIELRQAFNNEGFLLSAAVSPNKAVIDEGYDVPVLSRTLDWISVMAYDYHGQWDKKTGHVSPMYAHPDDYDMKFNSNFTLYYWVSKGADPRKLVMGMPTYGQSFSLATAKDNGLNVPTYGGGEAGEATRSRGFLAYYEICYRIIKQNWRVVQDPLETMGPYAYSGDQWVSFDDQEMIRYKSQFVVRNDLGGAMIWALDLDDFKNVCGCETYPLLKTINRVLGRIPEPGPDCSLDQSENDIETRMLKSFNPDDAKILMSNKNQNCEEPLLKSHPDDCNKYLICQFGEIHVQSCPDTLYFNKENQLCDWPSSVNCTMNTLS